MVKTTKTTVKKTIPKPILKESTEAKTNKRIRSKDIKAKAAADKKAVEIAVKRDAVSVFSFGGVIAAAVLAWVFKAPIIHWFIKQKKS
jgi:hypothetical protein